jgi:hypothetical protein
MKTQSQVGGRTGQTEGRTSQQSGRMSRDAIPKGTGDLSLKYTGGLRTIVGEGRFENGNSGLDREVGLFDRLL